MNPQKDILKKKKSGKKRLFRLFFFAVLFFFIVLPTTLILLTFEKSPIVSETRIADVQDATRVRTLAKNTFKILFQSTDTTSISASEDDLNAVLAFMARGVSRFAGRANITPKELEIMGTLRLPHNPIGDYINVQVSLRPSESGLNLKHVRVCKIKLSGPVALFIMRFSLNMALGEEQGTMLIYSVQSVIFKHESITLHLRPLPELKFKRLKYLKERIKSVRDYVAPLGDPVVVRIYYLKLIELAHAHKGKRSVSLAQFIHPLFQLAQQRSTANDPEVENHAAIMALSMFAGSHRFEHFIGSVTTEEMKSYRIKTNNIVLGGRQDLRLHFIISAGLKLVAESGISYAAGEFKELLDAGRGGSGFSFVDLAADRTGIRFAEIATDRSGSAKRLQLVLANKTNEALFFPQVDDLPEELSQEEFEKVYGGIEDTKYLALVDKIDKRINQLPAYQKNGVN